MFINPKLKNVINLFHFHLENAESLHLTSYYSRRGQYFQLYLITVMKNSYNFLNLNTIDQ